YVKQPHASHYIPCAQLSLILILTVPIAMKTVNPIKFVADGAHPLLGQMGLPRKIKQPGYVQIWLITVIVKSMYSCKSVHRSAASEHIFPRFHKDTVQAPVKHIFPDPRNQLLRLVRHVERILNRISLLEPCPRRHRVKWL